MRISDQADSLGLLFVAATAITCITPVSCTNAQGASAAGEQAHVVRYDIPGQPLTSALAAFARQSGLKLAYGAALSQGRIAPPLQGSFTIAQALSRLLAGTGLSYRFSGPATLTIERQNEASGTAGTGALEGGVTLPTIDVTGNFSFLYRNANNGLDFYPGPIFPDNRLYIAPAMLRPKIITRHRYSSLFLLSYRSLDDVLCLRTRILCPIIHDVSTFNRRPWGRTASAAQRRLFDPLASMAEDV